MELFVNKFKGVERNCRRCLFINRKRDNYLGLGKSGRLYFWHDVGGKVK